MCYWTELPTAFLEQTCLLRFQTAEYTASELRVSAQLPPLLSLLSRRFLHLLWWGRRVGAFLLDSADGQEQFFRAQGRLGGEQRLLGALVLLLWLLLFPRRLVAAQFLRRGRLWGMRSIQFHQSIKSGL